MEPTIELGSTIELDLTPDAFRVDRRLGLRQRLEGRHPAETSIELDLRAIAQERLALPQGRRRR